MRFDPRTRRNTLAFASRGAGSANFLLNLGWSLYWLTRSAYRLLKKRI